MQIFFLFSFNLSNLVAFLSYFHIFPLQNVIFHDSTLFSMQTYSNNPSMSRIVSLIKKMKKTQQWIIKTGNYETCILFIIHKIFQASNYLSICIYIFIYLSIYLLSVYLYVSIYLSIFLRYSICLYIYLSVYISIYLYSLNITFIYIFI